MSKKSILYIAFFAALVLIFYFVLTQVIPGFTERKVEPISYIKPFSFIDQDGERFTEKDVEGKVFVAEYFFTTCPSICPQMNKNMRLVYDALKDDSNFLILSHTSMPEVDSASTLKAYANTLGVDTHKWIFLTGRKDSLYNMARFSYTIDDPKNNVMSIEDQFMHTQFWALVDQKGDVRKIYDGIKESEARNLIEDAKKLLKNK